jgi:hypothetical protein
VKVVDVADVTLLGGGEDEACGEQGKAEEGHGECCEVACAAAALCKGLRKLSIFHIKIYPKSFRRHF